MVGAAEDSLASLASGDVTVRRDRGRKGGARRRRMMERKRRRMTEMKEKEKEDRGSERTKNEHLCRRCEGGSTKRIRGTF